MPIGRARRDLKASTPGQKQTMTKNTCNILFNKFIANLTGRTWWLTPHENFHVEVDCRDTRASKHTKKKSQRSKATGSCAVASHGVFVRGVARVLAVMWFLGVAATSTSSICDAAQCGGRCAKSVSSQPLADQQRTTVESAMGASPSAVGASGTLQKHTPRRREGQAAILRCGHAHVQRNQGYFMEVTHPTSRQMQIQSQDHPQQHTPQSGTFFPKTHLPLPPFSSLDTRTLSSNLHGGTNSCLNEMQRIGRIN